MTTSPFIFTNKYFKLDALSTPSSAFPPPTNGTTMEVRLLAYANAPSLIDETVCGTEIVSKVVFAKANGRMEIIL